MMKFFDLVSKVGGTLGVFLGSSFVVFVELIEILTKLLSHFM